MIPVQKSVKAKPLSSIQNGVRMKFFLHTAAKINAFPATATGERKAMIIEVGKKRDE